MAVSVPIPDELPDDAVVHALDFLERYRDLYRLSAPASQLYLDRVTFDEENPVRETDGRHLYFRCLVLRSRQ